MWRPAARRRRFKRWRWRSDQGKWFFSEHLSEDIMRGKRWLVAVAAAVVLGLGFAGGVVYSQRVAAKSFEQRLAEKAGLREETVIRLLKALGPIATEDLRKGEQVVLPGLGALRVVRVAEHRDLRNGRPVTVAAANYVEFIPTGDLVNAANTEGARAAETVPEFRYIPLPNQTPSQKAPSRIRVDPVRSR
jgi:nucleoid DNA-binding protein